MAYVVLWLLVISSVIFIPHVSSNSLVPVVDRYEEVTVQPGDTLWTIAGRHKSPRMDTREMVERIRSTNDLADTSLRPGKVLRVPVVR